MPHCTVSTYLSSGSPLTVVIETLRQRIAATSRKIARCAAKTKGFYQNKLFAAGQHKFYTYLSSAAKDNTNITPNNEDVVKFWTSLWSDDTPHNELACWVRQVAGDLQDMTPQECIHISISMVSSTACKLSNWRAPGPDGIHTFWIKHLSSLHPRLAAQIQDCVDGEVPRWLTLGRTVLIMKNKEVGPEVVTNYRPITCLSNLWKLATSMMSAAIVCHLNRNQVWPWE